MKIKKTQQKKKTLSTSKNNNKSKQKNKVKRQAEQYPTIKNNADQNQITEHELMLKKIMSKQKLTQSQYYIKDILTNKILYKDTPLDQSIFKSQLVIKLKVPKQSYIKRNQKMELGSILRKYSQTMLRSYQAAYEQLYQGMSDEELIKKYSKNDYQLRIRSTCSFKPLTRNAIDISQNQSIQNFRDCIRKRRTIQYSQEQVYHNCWEMTSGYLDAFTISYNTLIYSLQQFCGFRVKTFMTSNLQQYHKDIRKRKYGKVTEFQQVLYQNSKIDRVIYILLYLPNQTLIKAANKYHIKKQIDYAQIDPFLNQPTDKKKRPIKLSYKNSQIMQQLNSQGYQQVQKVKSNSASISNPRSLQIKTIERKLGFIVPKQGKIQILASAQLNQQQNRKYLQYQKGLKASLSSLIGQNYQILKPSQYIIHHNDYNHFNDPKNEDSLTAVEKDYLYRVNRGKVNPGVEKRYVQVKKQRKYFQILKELSKKYGYDVYDEVPTYTQFKLANKKNKFFSRLDKMLLYKQTVISPYGQLALFNTMESIKLSYLVLKEHIRVQNFHMLNSQVIALSNDYQKYGRLGSIQGYMVQKKFHYYYKQPGMKIMQGIQGGLNGKNLLASWHRIFFWKTNYENIRNYLGQSKTFQIFMKTKMIYMFMFLAPLGIALQLIKVIFIDPGAANSGYYPELYFYLLYMLLITIVYGIFQEKYRRSELNFIQNFIQTAPNVQFLNEYKGPYMRDPVNDNANAYSDKFITFSDTLKICLSFSIMFLIVGFEVGFYYGIRQIIVELSFLVYEIRLNFQYIRLVQLIGYSIYFIVNQILSSLIIPKLAKFLTQNENRPTKQAYVNSNMSKLFIFAIAVQIIPPVDLLFIQDAAKTSCSSDWCAKQLQAYVYCKYCYIIVYSLFSFIVLMINYLKSNAKPPKLNVQKVQYNFSNRLSMFLSFVYKQSKKRPSDDFNLVDQTVALIHFATFLTILPLAPTLSLLNIFINYNIQRTQLLYNQQRPIPKLQSFKPYRKIIVAIGHWMLFFNFSRIFITLQTLQYLFPNLVLLIISPPSPNKMMILRYSTVLLFMFIYQIIMKLTVNTVKRTHSIMDKRKINMLKKHQIRILNSGKEIQVKKPKPINTISRTYDQSVKQNLYQYTENNQYSYSYEYQGSSNFNTQQNVTVQSENN